LLWTSKAASTATKLMATAVFGGFGLVMLIGMASSKPSASPSAAYVPAQAIEPQPIAAPAPEPKPEESAPEVDIKTLLAEYKTNEVRADATYKDKYIIITGKVGEVKKDIMGKIYVTIGTGQMYEFPVVQCFIRETVPDIRRAAQLSKGDKVTAVGQVSGLMMNVLMKECRFPSN
jgi:hypothetical protein